MSDWAVQICVLYLFIYLCSDVCIYLCSDLCIYLGSHLCSEFHIRVEDKTCTADWAEKRLKTK